MILTCHSPLFSKIALMNEPGVLLNETDGTGDVPGGVGEGEPGPEAANAADAVASATAAERRRVFMAIPRNMKSGVYAAFAAMENSVPLFGSLTEFYTGTLIVSCASALPGSRY